jgi:hypothetical protein
MFGKSLVAAFETISEEPDQFVEMCLKPTNASVTVILCKMLIPM